MLLWTGIYLEILNTAEIGFFDFVKKTSQQILDGLP